MRHVVEIDFFGDMAAADALMDEIAEVVYGADGVVDPSISMTSEQTGEVER